MQQQKLLKLINIKINSNSYENRSLSQRSRPKIQKRDPIRSLFLFNIYV